MEEETNLQLIMTVVMRLSSVQPTWKRLNTKYLGTVITEYILTAWRPHHHWLECYNQGINRNANGIQFSSEIHFNCSSKLNIEM